MVFFAKNGEQEKDSPEVEEGDRLSGSSKKGAKNAGQTSRVEWWEMLNWEEMKEVYERLPLSIKEKLREKGLAPKG